MTDQSYITMQKQSMSIGCPLYEEIKLRKEEGQGRRPLNTRDVKLSEVAKGHVYQSRNILEERT